MSEKNRTDGTLWQLAQEADDHVADGKTESAQTVVEAAKTVIKDERNR